MIMADKKQEFPAWMYGPDGQGQIFQNAEEVPNGFVDHPSLVKGAQPVDKVAPPDGSTNPVVPGIDDLDKIEIGKRLEALEVEHNLNWSKTKLYELLVEAEQAKAQNPGVNG
jgi:hypothetical protein